MLFAINHLQHSCIYICISCIHKFVLCICSLINLWIWYLYVKHENFVGLPIPIVVVSVILSYDKYGIKDDNGETIS